MPKFVIERNIPGIGRKTPDEQAGIARASCDVLDQLGPTISWVHSYATEDKLYCVYIAENADQIREHAKRGGFPADRISEVKALMDPTTAAAPTPA